MKTFVLMSRLSPQGSSLVEVASKMRDGARTARTWIDRAQKICPEVRFVAHYALLGSYDFMDIYEAPSEESAAKISMICSSDGIFNVESWTAIPDRRLVELVEEVSTGMSEDDDL